MKVSCKIMSDFLHFNGLQPVLLLCPWSSPGKSTGVVCHFLLQGIVPTQRSNLGFLHYRQILYQLSHQGRPWFNSWVGKIYWRTDRLPTAVFSGFPHGSDSKESACNVGDLGSIPGSGRSPGEGNGWLPTPVFLPRELHGQRSLAGCSLSNFHFHFIES